MQFQVPDLFVAPYLKLPTADAWQDHREQYYAYRSRGGSLAIRLLIARDVWEVLKLRDPSLEEYEVPDHDAPAGDDVPLLIQGDANNDGTDSDSSSDDSDDDEDEAPEQLPVPIPALENDQASVAIICRINAIFQPLDKQDALDSFTRITCKKRGSTYQNALNYVFQYQRQLENCADVKPPTKRLVRQFIGGLEPERLRDRVNTIAPRNDLQAAFKAALEQSRHIEQTQRETRHLDEARAPPANHQTSRAPGKATNTVTCSYCHKSGHSAEQCFAKKRAGKSGKYEHCLHVMATDRAGRKSSASAEIEVEIPHDNQVSHSSALIDSGATANFVSHALVTTLGLPMRPYSGRVRVGSGQVVNVEAICTIEMSLGRSRTGHKLSVIDQFLVLRHLPYDIIFGLPSSLELGLITFNVGSDIVAEEPDEGSEVEFNLLEEEPLELNVQIPSLREEVTKIVEEHHRVFEPLSSEPSALEAFKIRLTEGKTTNTPPYRYSLAVQDEIRLQTSQQLDLGIIESSDSPYNSPIVAVVKRDNSIRLCLDFRRLNDITEPDEHPLPLIEDLLDQLEGSAYYATLDLSKAFLQVPLDPESRQYTAFIADNHKYHYCRMPFGLRNAAIHMQRALEKVMGADLFTAALVYIDDIVVMGKTRSEFLKNLRSVLERLDDANVRVNLKKTILAAHEIDYLGWHVTPTGRSISPDRLEPILSMRAPTNISEVRTLLGMVNYFRPTIPTFADIAEPIIALTRADTPFAWNSEQQAAFDELRRQLTSGTILTHPRPGDDLHLFTDASDIGIGGVLMVKRDTTFLPVQFFSKTLSATQRRWSTIEQEMFALVSAIDKFSKYLMASHFTAHTDHRNLVWMATSTNPKVRRWRLAVDIYDFTVLHVAGKDNGCADTLSRLLTLSVEDRQEIISSVHGGTEGHLGYKETVRRIRDQYSGWRGMVQDVREFITHCPTCQLQRPNRPPPYQHHRTAATEPFGVVQLDTLGPLPISPEGFKYIIVAVDTFTKFTKLYPARTTNADSAVEALIDWSAHFGRPREIQSDNGSQYRNELVALLTAAYSIPHHYSTPYRPASNGIVERANAEIVRHLRTLLHDNRMATDRWPQLLNHVMRIINESAYSLSGLTPIQLLFGRDTRIPLQPDAGIELSKTENALLQSLQSQVKLFRQWHQAKLASIKAYDNNDRAQSFKPNDWVLLTPTGHVPKLQAPVRGPLLVVGAGSDPNVYEIQDLSSLKSFFVHQERLRKFLPGTLTANQIAELAAAQAGEYIVDKIIGHSLDDQGRLVLRISWQGYEEAESTDEIFNRDLDKLAAVDIYLDEHPEATALIKAARRKPYYRRS
ncbi:hypothetical protein J8273_8189 [Carpediemonas membranifera]|uniref:Reverse transcriptase n=1 Tax=Carpediemonas membranifera TaxID=201153 RepID=A0A8J6AS69_9EUKA|nr:hypothetical protein J8273_8189 [Carpediemonas membranifera]|eukprot:KAG9390150.1 hypothetical protein J8273_8189 [Carpediemonas membranifera]